MNTWPQKDKHGPHPNKQIGIAMARIFWKQTAQQISSTRHRNASNSKYFGSLTIKKLSYQHNTTQLPWLQIQYEALGYQHLEVLFSNLLQDPWTKLINWVITWKKKEKIITKIISYQNMHPTLTRLTHKIIQCNLLYQILLPLMCLLTINKSITYHIL